MNIAFVESRVAGTLEDLRNASPQVDYKLCRVKGCRESTKDRMFKRGFNKFIKEIEITNMLRTIRILKSNAKRNFSKIQWRIYKLQKGTRKLHLDQYFDK